MRLPIMVLGTMALGTTGVGDRQARRLSRISRNADDCCAIVAAQGVIIGRPPGRDKDNVGVLSDSGLGSTYFMPTPTPCGVRECAH